MTHGSAPGRNATPAVLDAIDQARRLGPSLSEELLTHLPDLGDPVTQRTVDSWVEQAADTLRALSEALEERLIELGRAPAGPRRTTHRTAP